MTERGATMDSGPAYLCLVREVIDIADVLHRVSRPEAGAVDIFIGTTRNHNAGRSVLELEYSAFDEMALEQIRVLEREVRLRWNVIGVAVVHRLGRVPVGEASVVIAVSSVHRKDAFEACRFAIDTLKRDVPIWKKEFYESGEAWMGDRPA